MVVQAGEIVGRGRHRRCGGDHAEVAALKSAGSRARGATVYCTLEPCSRSGRVGPCTEALIAAGVKRVVWACNDPNPKNAHRAAKVLTAAGIACECGLCKDEAQRLLRPFAKHIRTGLPWLTVKLAMTLDGKICDAAGDAKWITAPATRRATGKLREVADAIMVGANTIRCDDPSLLSHGKSNPDLLRVVVCSRPESIPANAQVLTDAAHHRTIIAHGDGKRVDVTQLMRTLGAMGLMHVVCEGGLELARELAAAGLVDEWICALAPMVMGGGKIGAARRGKFSRVTLSPANEVIAEALCSRA